MRRRPVDRRQRREKPFDRLVQLEPAAAGKLQRPPYAAFRQALEQRPLLGRGTIQTSRRERGLGRLPQRIRWQRLQIEPATARTDGGQEATGLRCDQQEDGARRRFLERL